MGRLTYDIDWVAIVLLLCLTTLGLFILLSVNQALFFQQMLYVIVGFIFLGLLSLVDSAVLWWFAPLGYVIANIFIALSYLGPSVRGATRWIMVGGIQLQPSELAKPLLLLCFARFVSIYPPRIMKYIPLHIGLFLLPFFLVFRQPDLGSGIVYGCFWFAVMLAGGLPLKVVIPAGGFVGLLSPLFFRILAEYQKARIFTFLNPTMDPRGAGYNALQAMIAVGSGQLFGRGLGRGTQSHLRFLPEFHTDFIFATLVEELGFFGGLVLIIGYGILLWRIIMPFLKAKMNHIFPFSYSVGLFAMLLTQIFINAGMNMGIIPITGITLPFISYGGSSILSLAISFGILWALQRGKYDDHNIAIPRYS